MVEEYYKLVRDKIPQIMVKEGENPHIQVIEDNKLYELDLENKLREEVNELLESHSIEEFGDVLEVLECLALSLGLSWDSIIKAQNDKRRKKGSFKKKVFLDKVDKV